MTCLGSFMVGARDWVWPAVVFGSVAIVAVLVAYAQPCHRAGPRGGRHTENYGLAVAGPLPARAAVERQTAQGRCQPGCRAGGQQPEPAGARSWCAFQPGGRGPPLAGTATRRGRRVWNKDLTSARMPLTRGSSDAEPGVAGFRR